MRVERVEMENFRLFEAVQLEVAAGLNLLYGENAQGKTTFLEALAILAAVRSFRTHNDRELVREGAEEAAVRARARRDSQAERWLEVRWLGSGRTVSREARIGGRRVGRLAEFLGELPLVVFTPADLALVQGPPVLRRAYLDRLLCKLYPAYLSALARYRQALEQRNALLRVERSPSPSALAPWDTQLALHGAAVTRRREEVCGHLDREVRALHERLSGEEEPASLRYRLAGGLDEESLLERLGSSRGEDLRRRTTQAGPHRDDLELRRGAWSFRRFGSQGQQRTMALALRLAEARVLQSRAGEGAIVLLDDCLSELDPGRRRRLLELLAEHPQVFVTGTTLPEQVPAGSACYRVGAGGIHRTA